MIYMPETKPQKEFLLKWAMKSLGIAHFTNDAYPIAVFRNEKMACVAIYHDYIPPSVLMSIYAIDPGWATRKNIQCLYSYAFTARPIGLGAGRITGLVEKKNKRSRRFLEGIGFILEGCSKKAGRRGEDDLMIYGLLRNALKVKTKNISVEGNVKQLRVANYE